MILFLCMLKCEVFMGHKCEVFMERLRLEGNLWESCVEILLELHKE